MSDTPHQFNQNNMNLHQEDRNALIEYIDTIRLGKRATGGKMDAEMILEKLGYSLDEDANRLADVAEEIINGNINCGKLYAIEYTGTAEGLRKFLASMI